MKIKVKRTSETAVLPTHGSSAAAGYDLHADVAEPVRIGPGETKLIDTGLRFELPEGYFAGIFARSGLASREGLRPANCVGVCDSDYRGNYMVSLHNDSSEPRVITAGEKIAQMIVMAYLPLEFEETAALSETARGEGGFGSTGRQ
ncbi:dUTP diphosphatase [Lachnoclostridium sp. Marseille-P6806]|uniref:dUTP diphosphatase n=1 Tax=Lachnoclostridium sp. Marseille-P6806 TaxID=2364793 RepID=UPI00102FAFDA|nr:dUTP diphosphatase [Lachnoclostridium sp. Marseille-P6806]